MFIRLNHEQCTAYENSIHGRRGRNRSKVASGSVGFEVVQVVDVPKMRCVSLGTDSFSQGFVQLEFSLTYTNIWLRSRLATQGFRWQAICRSGKMVRDVSLYFITCIVRRRQV